MKLTILLALIALIIGFMTSRMVGPPKPKPKPSKPKDSDEFDVLLDEYMIHDPDLDGKI